MFQGAGPVNGPASKHGFGDLEEEGRQASTRWLHVPAREHLRITVLSERAYRYEAHWVNGRMMICPGQGCYHCARRQGSQVRYVMSVLDRDTGGRAFLELSAEACRPIGAAVQACGELRGLEVDLSHEGGRRNGALIVKALGLRVALSQLPEAEDPGPHVERQAMSEAARQQQYALPVAADPETVRVPSPESRNGDVKAAREYILKGAVE